jgi:hypothetical protein
VDLRVAAALLEGYGGICPTRENSLVGRGDVRGLADR